MVLSENNSLVLIGSEFALYKVISEELLPECTDITSSIKSCLFSPTTCLFRGCFSHLCYCSSRLQLTMAVCLPPVVGCSVRCSTAEIDYNDIYLSLLNSFNSCLLIFFLHRFSMFLSSETMYFLLLWWSCIGILFNYVVAG